MDVGTKEQSGEDLHARKKKQLVSYYTNRRNEVVFHKNMAQFE